jgi:Tol biopolymer transport system component
VFVLDRTTGESLQLTGGGAHYYAPVWSPDGAFIAVAEESLGRSRLLLLDAGGGNQRVLYNGLAVFNAWSPDGAYAIITVAGQPLIIDSATGQAAPLDIQGFEDEAVDVTAWNGDRIAFTHIDGSAQRIYIAGIDGSNPHRALQDLSDHHSLRWSSDGSSFVYISAQNSAFGDVYMAAADGSNVRRQTFSGDSVHIVTLAYWSPTETRGVHSPLPSSLTFKPLDELLDTTVPVDPNDPVSVTYSVLSSMLSGTLADDAALVCPDFRDTYIGLSAAINADFADPDLTGLSITLVQQHAEWAQVRLSGSMSILASGTRTIFPASLIPVQTNPLADLYLVNQSGWKLCTPL